MRGWPLLFVVACVPAPADLCRRGVDLQCQRQFECESDAVKMSPGFQGGWGVDVNDCDTKVAEQAGCDDKVTQDDLCPTGQHFDLGAAEQCSGDVQAQSCADFLDPAKVPASCSTKCK
jgi:hypothetical protein